MSKPKGWVLEDSAHKVVYNGFRSECEELLRVLTCDPAHVTEKDEVKWEKELRSIKWTGNLNVTEY